MKKYDFLYPQRFSTLTESIISSLYHSDLQSIEAHFDPVSGFDSDTDDVSYKYAKGTYERALCAIDIEDAPAMVACGHAYIELAAKHLLSPTPYSRSVLESKRKEKLDGLL
jgi:hypothetical protein